MITDEQMATDAAFSTCAFSTALLFSKFNIQPSYFYYYRHRGAYTYPDLVGIPPLPDLGITITFLYLKLILKTKVGYKNWL